MEKQTILEKLTLIFNKVFNYSSITLYNELSAKDVENWDSLTHMLLITEIEKEFSIKFRLKDLNKMKNIGDMIDIIISKL